MALIPDEAIDRMDELSSGAWKLYCFLCRCRNQSTGKCYPSVRTSAGAINVHEKNIFKLRRELSAAGWAIFDSDAVTALFGFGSKNTTADDARKEISGDSSKNTTSEADGSKNATDQSQKHYPAVAKTLPDGSKNATAYKEEPAKEPANLTSKEEPAKNAGAPASAQLNGFHLSQQEPPDCDLRDRIALIVRKRTGTEHVGTSSVERRVNGEVAALVDAGATLADVEAFEAQRIKGISLGFYAADFLKWFSDRGRGQPGAETWEQERKRRLKQLEEQERNYGRRH